MRVPHDTRAAALLGLYAAPVAQAYYRLAVPLGAIGGAVAPFAARSSAQAAAARTVVLTLGAFTPRGEMEPDAGERFVKQLQAGGLRVVVDLDDALDPPPGKWPAAWGRHTQAHMAGMLRAANAVTCTGEALAASLRPLNRRVRLVPNYIRPADWPAPAPAPADGPPVVVLAGGASHGDDWRIAAPALRELREQGRIRLRCVGYCPPYLRDVADDVRPWASLDDYPAALAGAHIGLCPLPLTPFNACKSPVKAYEYALAGLAVVASPCQYGAALRGAGLGAYVVPDAADWRGPLEALALDAETRRQAAAALRSSVLSAYDVRRHVGTIRAAYAA